LNPAFDNKKESLERGPEGPLYHPARPADATLTRTGVAMGSVGYMSPEQVRGEKLDPRTDIFSFGLVLYEMATGQRAFTGETAAVVHDAILKKSPIPVSELNSTLPAVLVVTIDRALEKDRDKRYQSVAEMQSELGTLQRRLSVYEHPGWRYLRQSAVGIALVLILVVGYWYWRTHRTVHLGQKDTLVLADFTNSTGDAIFDGTLRQALAIQLEESPFLNLLSDRRVSETLKLMNRPANERLTEATAREACTRADGRAVLTGAIAPAGDRYQVSLKAVDCRSGETLAASNVEATDRTKILPAVDDAATRLREKLGESLASMQKSNKPLEEVTTSSLEALQAYTQGRNKAAQQSDVSAVPYFKLALELDPNFVYAYTALGTSYNNLYQTALSIPNFTKAFALREQVSARERFAIEGNYYMFAVGDFNRAIQAYTDWARAYPRDATPHRRLSMYLRQAGQNERAAAEARAAVDLTPDDIAAVFNLMISLSRLDRMEEAKATYDEARARKLDGAILRIGRYLLASIEEDAQGMQEQLQWAKGKPGIEDFMLSFHSSHESYFGHFGKARELTDVAVASAKQANGAEREALWRVQEGFREALVGNDARAREKVLEALDLSATQEVRVNAALTFALSGELARAQNMADKLKREAPSDTLLQSQSVPAIRAAIMLQKNNPSQAIEVLKTVTPYELGGESLCCLTPVYLRGLAFLRARRGQQAAAEFQKLLDHPGIASKSVSGALAHLQLARAQLMMGDKDAARRSYQDFLTLWKDADRDIPIYQQAKAEYAKVR
jgi:tetratricopeptide (TPR) repeat protein